MTKDRVTIICDECFSTDGWKRVSVQPHTFKSFNKITPDFTRFLETWECRGCGAETELYTETLIP